MKTEIQGNWKDYVKRFRLPPMKVLLIPIKRFSICLILQIVFGGITLLMSENGLNPGALLFLIVSSMVIGGYLYAVYKEFWNVVLEASKGLWADVLMWIYYAICTFVIVIVPLIIVGLIMKV